MKEIKQVNSNIKKEMEFVIVWGILIGVILNILDMFPFFRNVFEYPLLRIYRRISVYTIGQWPVCMLTGVLIAAVVMLLRRTTVLVTKDVVTITRIGKKVQLSIDDFDAPVIQRKAHLLFDVLKWITLKIYLNFSYLNGTKSYRLFEFSEEELEKAIQYIREQRNENMPVEEKIAVLDSLNNMQNATMVSESLYEDERETVQDKTPLNVFSLSRLEIKQYEQNTLLKIAGICLGLLVFLLVCFWCKFFSMEDFKVIFAMLIGGITLAAVPFLLLWLFWKLKHCPQTIRICSDAMWVDEKYFTYTGLSYISMTSPRKQSDSAFPVQYWMTIKKNGEKHKYWLGSEASYGEYKELCKTLEKALIMHPNKMRYRGK